MHLKEVTLHRENYPTREHYPYNLEIFYETGSISFETQITFFVGENGTGKSTFLEAITNKCGIHIWRGLERTRCTNNPFELTLSQYISCEWTKTAVPGSFFGSGMFRNFAVLLDEWAAVDPGLLDYFGGKSLLTQSHGQSLMSFFKNRFTVEGLYILDEPETALSPRTQLAFLDILMKMSGQGHAQFIIATHSPILLACPGATIYSFDHIPIKQLEYGETEHFRLYKDFLNNPPQVLQNRL
jgi:predicted ATPase